MALQFKAFMADDNITGVFFFVVIATFILLK